MTKIKVLFFAALALGAVYLTLTAGPTVMADGSDPMPACRGKVCPPAGR